MKLHEMDTLFLCSDVQSRIPGPSSPFCCSVFQRRHKRCTERFSTSRSVDIVPSLSLLRRSAGKSRMILLFSFFFVGVTRSFPHGTKNRELIRLDSMQGHRSRHHEEIKEREEKKARTRVCFFSKKQTKCKQKGVLVRE